MHPRLGVQSRNDVVKTRIARNSVHTFKYTRAHNNKTARGASIGATIYSNSDRQCTLNVRAFCRPNLFACFRVYIDIFFHSNLQVLGLLAVLPAQCSVFYYLMSTCRPMCCAD